MDNILLLDTSVASLNKGDGIIMECTRKELAPLLKDNFELNLPTHVSPFHWYQVLRNSSRVQLYAECKYKFVGGSNILIPDLRTHFPQWNINLFNYKPLMGSVLVGVGAGRGAEGSINWYTRHIYNKLLSHDYYHSVRDERSKEYMQRLGLKAINTGCVTMWLFTPDFCQQIPVEKSEKVVFTLNGRDTFDDRDQKLVDILLRNYSEVYFWPQGHKDFNYLRKIKGYEKVQILQATKESYSEYLSNNETDYVGTRLHGGIYAMRHKRRSIIIAIDERARSIHKKNHLNCIEYSHIDELENLINSSIVTDVEMDFEAIEKWRKQFF